jgi:DNA-binding NarL/FixJ family response regulator
LNTAVTNAAGPARPKARLFVVDDHPVVRHGLTQLISAEPDLEVCGEAAGETDALQGVEERRPDLVLVDISLAQGSGLGLLRRLRAADEKARLLVVSMHDEMVLAEKCLEAGAIGYVNKAEATDRLVDAVRCCLAGKVYLSSEVTETLLQQKAGAKRSGATGIEALSDRELEVFDMIAQGTATRDIAARLHLSVKTVETYRDNIKKKLGLESNLALIRRAMGWRLLGGAEHTQGGAPST